jgi:hypothetical protein
VAETLFELHHIARLEVRRERGAGSCEFVAVCSRAKSPSYLTLDSLPIRRRAPLISLAPSGSGVQTFLDSY